MRKTFYALLKDEKGQTMTEYLMIILLVAFAAVGSWIIFHDALRDKIQMAATSINMMGQ